MKTIDENGKEINAGIADYLEYLKDFILVICLPIIGIALSILFIYSIIHFIIKFW